MEEKDSKGRDRQEEIYEKAVRAGKRTYFFDVRSTRNQDYYLTITESKKRFNEDGTFFYQKHKLFLYKEDFEKFSDALSDAFKKIIELNKESGQSLESNLENKFSDVQFEDLGVETEGQKE